MALGAANPGVLVYNRASLTDLSKLDRYARDYPAGAIVFEEGDEAEVMYVVQRGEIDILRHGVGEPRLLAVIPPGEFFGEMGLINGSARTATARVRKDARLLELTGEVFEAMVRSRTEIAIRMIKTMSGRLERTNDQVELLLLNDSVHRVVECLRLFGETQGEVSEDGAWVHVPVSIEHLASSVALSVDDTADILQRLAMARIVVHASEAGIETGGFVVPDVEKLFEFLEFLDLRERCA